MELRHFRDRNAPMGTAIRKINIVFHNPSANMKEETFFRRNGILKLRSLFLVIFISEMLLYFIITSIPYSNAALVAQLKAEEDATYSLGLVGMIFSIFPHNLLIATLEFIPVVGQFFFISSMIETPLVLSATASTLGVPGIITFISLLFLPDTIVELPSYAVATATSIYLFYLLIKGRSVLREKARKILHMYLFTVLELFIAGTLESAAIEMGLTLPSPDKVIYPLLLWIPTIPILYLLIRLFRRINSDEYDRGRKGVPEGFELQ